MTLGTGIFLSSLFLGLILLFWITKDRWRWGRILLWLVGGVAAISGAIYLYVSYEPPPRPQLEYADLRLGVSQGEVNYIKGVPTNVVHDDPSNPGYRVMTAINELKEGSTAADFFEWSYSLATYSNARLDVSFDKDRKLRTVACYSTGYLNCPSVLGLHDGSGEEEVVARLGEPSSTALNGVTKRMVYQPLNVMFYLIRRKVYMIYISEGLP